MILKKIKMPTCMQGCHTLKVLFIKEATGSTINPENIRMTECYVYCEKSDEKVIRKIINEIKERYHERN